MVLANKRITKALIRLRGCAGWSAPVLLANPRRQVFSRRGLNVRLLNQLFWILTVFHPCQESILVCLFDLVLDVCLIWFSMSQSTVFQSCGDRPSSVDPVMCLAQGHNAVPLVRLEPTTPQSRVMHSTTEPLRSQESILITSKLHNWSCWKLRSLHIN